MMQPGEAELSGCADAAAGSAATAAQVPPWQHLVPSQAAHHCQLGVLEQRWTGSLILGSNVGGPSCRRCTLESPPVLATH